jgi:hypothetical protein
VPSLDFTLIICVILEDVHATDRVSASYSSGIAGAATNGFIVLTNSSNLADLGKKS